MGDVRSDSEDVTGREVARSLLDAFDRHDKLGTPEVLIAAIQFQEGLSWLSTMASRKDETEQGDSEPA